MSYKDYGPCDGDPNQENREKNFMRTFGLASTHRVPSYYIGYGQTLAGAELFDHRRIFRVPGDRTVAGLVFITEPYQGIPWDKNLEYVHPLGQAIRQQRLEENGRDYHWHTIAAVHGLCCLAAKPIHSSQCDQYIFVENETLYHTMFERAANAGLHPISLGNSVTGWNYAARSQLEAYSSFHRPEKGQP